MKTNKIIAVVACAAMLMSTAACGQKTKKAADSVANGPEKALVAYFSASETGNTRVLAKKVAEAAGADLYEITPDSLYTAADLDWTVEDSRSTIEMRDSTSRPAIKGTVENLADYNVVYVGFPVWWNSAPHVVNTFFETNDLSGKTIWLFGTSGGTTLAGALKDLKAAYPALDIKGAELLNGATQEQVADYVAKTRE